MPEAPGKLADAMAPVALGNLRSPALPDSKDEPGLLAAAFNQMVGSLRYLLAETNLWPEEAAEYFGEGDECHMNYHFPIMPRMFMALRMEDRYPIIDILEQTPELPEAGQWALFLRNHDELTLEMVTDSERDYMYGTYARDVQARVNLGIRRRLAPLPRSRLRRNRAGRRAAPGPYLRLCSGLAPGARLWLLVHLSGRRRWRHDAQRWHLEHTHRL